jgi:hypothetical protein
MNENSNEIIKQNNLMKAIGKSEVLIEQHEEALEEAEEKSEDIEGWLTIFLKAVKNIILN